MGVEILPSCIEAAILRAGREVPIAGIMNQRSHRAARGWAITNLVLRRQCREDVVAYILQLRESPSTQAHAASIKPHAGRDYSPRSKRRRRTGFSTSVNKNIATPMPITIAPSNGERGCVPNAALNQGR